MNTMSTGERIRALRIQKGMSQEELGRRVGLKKAAINKYETGVVVNLKRSVIAKLADVLETSPAYLMGWEYDEASSSPEILALMTELSMDHQSGRSDTRDAMLHTHGVEHSTHMLRIVNDKHVFLYYHPFDDERSGRAASTLMSILERLSPSDAEHLELLVEAYTAADSRARQMVDLALDPFLSRDLKDWVGSIVPQDGQE